MSANSRPNILLIMTDQHRGDCLSVEGHPVLQTPYMDALANGGTRFTHAYSTCPSCIPARRSLMSGQHPMNTGMVGYQDRVEWVAPPPLLPQVLHSHGYQTALVGRDMHLHPKRKRYGFEQQIYVSNSESDYGDWLKRNAPQEDFDYHGSGPTSNDWPARPWPFEEHMHATNFTVTQALRWLKYRDPTAPFFLTVQFLAPHPPLIPPAFYMDRYLRTGVPEPVIGDWAQPPTHKSNDPAPKKINLTGEALHSTRAAYYGLINHVDDQLRRLLRPIEGIARHRLPGLENTWVIFTSDHGEMLGDHYAWRKSVPYEPSARVPFLVRGPKDCDLPARAVLDQPICLEDIMPTCLDLAGAEIPQSVDGKSLLPLLRGEQTDWRDHLHIEHAPMHQTVTDGKEKYIWWVADGREQFFDLARDPEERHDCINDSEYTDRIAHWKRLLIEHLADRPEGFTDGKALIPGVNYKAKLDHAETSPWSGLVP